MRSGAEPARDLAPVVEVDAVGRRYGSTAAVDGVSFSVAEGEFFTLLGPNGAGKSTLLNMLTTLVAPTEGGATVMGSDVVRDSISVRRKLGVVFQEPALDERLTAGENLEIHAVLYGIPRRERRPAVEQALAWASLSEAGKRRVRAFSGGMKRRLELARALMHGPRVLFLDEPTLGLDPQGRRDLWDRIAILREERMTVLMTTHNLTEAEASDRVGILDQGKLIALGPPADLVAEHGGGQEDASLEDVFLKLTGRHLRDDVATGRDRMVTFAKRGGEHTR